MELQFPGNVYGTDGCRGGQSRCHGSLPFSSPLCHAVAINPDTQNEAEPSYRFHLFVALTRRAPGLLEFRSKG